MYIISLNITIINWLLNIELINLLNGLFIKQIKAYDYRINSKLFLFL